jgi:hypothetical protein
MDPADGDTRVAWDATIVASFSDPVTAADLTVDGGVTGTVTIAGDGMSAVFTPDADLAAGTTYTAFASVCDSTDAATFTTEQRDVAAASTYAVDLSSATFTDPAGISDYISQALTVPLLLGVQSTTATSIDMMGALGDDSSGTTVQDFCTSTFDFPSGDYSAAPAFSVGPSAITLSVGGYGVTVYDFVVTGTFAADLSGFSGGTIDGLIDTAPLASLVGGTDPGTVCGYAAIFGASCEACPDGSEYCLHMAATDVSGTLVTGLELEPVAGDECDSCDSWTSATAPALADQTCP